MAVYLLAMGPELNSGLHPSESAGETDFPTCEWLSIGHVFWVRDRSISPLSTGTPSGTDHEGHMYIKYFYLQQNSTQ